MIEMMTEQEYRAVRQLSYSGLKKFVDDRRGFYREYILWEKSKKAPSDDMVFGSLVDCLLLDKDNYDDRFYRLGGVVPSGQEKVLIDCLYKNTCLHIDENGVLQRDFVELFEASFNEACHDKNGERIAYKGKTFEGVLSKFEGSVGEEYYQTLRNNSGKCAISLDMFEQANRVIDTLRTNENVCRAINRESEGDVEVFNQLPLFFQYNGLDIKCLLDKVIVNHRKKKVMPFDLKITNFVEDFRYSYLKMKYYIQQFLYRKACMAQTEWMNYEVLPLQFITAHPGNYCQPQIYEMTEEDFIRAAEGFYIDGRWYEGVDKIVDNIQWHVAMDVWNTSRDSYEKNGKQNLKLNYG